MGSMINPNVPALKQVNLYQNGLRSVSETSLQRLGSTLPPQLGTIVWLNTDVPHTGNAVPGF